MNPKRAITFLIALFLLAGITLTGLAQDAPESAVVLIELAGPVAERDAEVSGLAWYGDYLFLLTENPNIYATEGNAGMFYALEKADILSYLLAQTYGHNPAALEPVAIPVNAPDIISSVAGFDGFEAVAFVGDQIFLNIEAELEDGSMRGYMVKGEIAPDLSSVTLDLENLVEMMPQGDYGNMSYESLLAAGDTLLAMYEPNGVAVNENPVAYVVSQDFQEVSTIPFPNLEYRLTDVTAMDADGYFWATNYFWPGEPEAYMATDSDPLFETYGRGPTHTEFPPVERLVQFQYAGDSISLVEQAPILLQLQDDNGRNWEGVARLGDFGLLIATDKFPGTLLGFVPLP